MAEQGFTSGPSVHIADLFLLPHSSGDRVKEAAPRVCILHCINEEAEVPEVLNDFRPPPPLASVGIWVGVSWTLCSHLGSLPVSSQVIGTLPWVVNSASVTAPAAAQSLQVQAVTPQLLLNAQGQVIATLASSPLPPPVAVRKPSTPESPAKSEVQGLRWGGVVQAVLSPCRLLGRTRLFLEASGQVG